MWWCIEFIYIWVVDVNVNAMCEFYMDIYIGLLDSHEPQNLTIWYQNAEIIPNGRILGESQLKAHSVIFNKSQANSYQSIPTEKVEFFNLICFCM